MWPDLAFAWLLLLALRLLLPLVNWREIPQRLRATARAERVYLFDPPLGCGWLGEHFVQRLFRLVRFEWLRLLELGPLLYALATVAELRARGARQTRLEEWKQSYAGLLYDLDTGRISEERFGALIDTWGYLPPASKLTWMAPLPLRMPPMRERLEWEQGLAGGAAASAAPPPEADSKERATAPAPQPAVKPDLVIRSLGHLELLADGHDLAPELLNHSVLSFVFLYLLAVQARKPGERNLRRELAQILFPMSHSKTAKTRNDKMRFSLHALRTQLPRPLALRIKKDAHYASLDLSGCDFDVHSLFDLAARAGEDRGSLPEALVEEIEDVLRQPPGVFLAEWEDAVERAGAGRSPASEVVAGVRQQVAAAYIQLSLALAGSYLATSQVARAVRALEIARQRWPDREDVGLKLIGVYEEAGQTQSAARLRREMDFG